MLNFWGPKIDKKVINSSTKCLISVKIAILTPHIIPPPLVNVWLIFDLQKYVNWLCVFLGVNPCFQRAHVFCMDLQPAADPYNVVCSYIGPQCLGIIPLHTLSQGKCGAMDRVSSDSEYMNDSRRGFESNWCQHLCDASCAPGQGPLL